MSWIRTTRIGGERFAAVEVPLAEEREAYRVTIRRGDSVLRTAETATPEFLYTAEMQADDSAGGPLTIGVAQLSAAYGFGPERTINV